MHPAGTRFFGHSRKKQVRRFGMFKQFSVKKIAKHAFTDAIEILSLIEVLEGANANSITEALNKAGAGRAAAHIQRSVFTRLHIIVARHYLPVKSKGDLHAKKAFQLLKNAEVRAGVVSHTQGDRLTEAETKWKACCEDQRLDPYLLLRHKQLAHLAEKQDDTKVPTYGDAFDIARNTAQCFSALANGVGIVTFDVESQIPIQWDSATAFWKPWKPA